MLELQFPEMLEANPELLAHQLHGGPPPVQRRSTTGSWPADARASGQANVEAISHLTRGLDLVATLPWTVERRRQEPDLLLALGPIPVNTKGPRTREVAETYSRALKLCSTLPDSPQPFGRDVGVVAESSSISRRRSR